MHRRHVREQRVRDETLIAGRSGSGCVRDRWLRRFRRQRTQRLQHTNQPAPYDVDAGCRRDARHDQSPNARHDQPSNARHDQPPNARRFADARWSNPTWWNRTYAWWRNSSWWNGAYAWWRNSSRWNRADAWWCDQSTNAWRNDSHAEWDQLTWADAWWYINSVANAWR